MLIKETFLRPGLNAEQQEFADLALATGLKPAGIARLLGVSRATVSKIASGKQTPRPHLLAVFRMRAGEIVAKAEPLETDKSVSDGRMKYPTQEEGGGMFIKDELPELKRKLDEIAASNDDLHMIKQVINYAYAKRSKKKTRKTTN